jgi:hypothetical protein
MYDSAAVLVVKPVSFRPAFQFTTTAAITDKAGFDQFAEGLATSQSVLLSITATVVKTHSSFPLFFA